MTKSILKKTLFTVPTTPILLALNQTVLVTKGLSATLPCPVLAPAAVKRRWLLNGRVLNADNFAAAVSKLRTGDGGGLVVADAAPGDEGNYTCEVRKGEAVASVEYKVVVQGQ